VFGLLIDFCDEGDYPALPAPVAACQGKTCDEPCDPCVGISGPCQPEFDEYRCVAWGGCFPAIFGRAPNVQFSAEDELCETPPQASGGAARPAADCETKSCGESCDPCLNIPAPCILPPGQYKCGKQGSCVLVAP
jgi:hypothetical protein